MLKKRTGKIYVASVEKRIILIGKPCFSLVHLIWAFGREDCDDFLSGEITSSFVIFPFIAEFKSSLVTALWAIFGGGNLKAFVKCALCIADGKFMAALGAISRH